MPWPEMEAISRQHGGKQRECMTTVTAKRNEFSTQSVMPPATFVRISPNYIARPIATQNWLSIHLQGFGHSKPPDPHVPQSEDDADADGFEVVNLD